VEPRTRRRPTIGGGGSGGIVASDRNVPGDYGETGPTRNSDTLAAIDAALNVAIAASTGDVLLVSFVAVAGTNNGSAVQGFFNYSVNGVAQFAPEFGQRMSGIDTELISYTDIHTVEAGEISGGLVTLIPLWAGTVMEIQYPPVFSVVNLGQVG